MSEAEDRILSGINIPKTIAGALAAVCAAVLGSFLGVAGTLVGAALASVVGSVATEVYHRSLRKGAKKLQTLGVPAFVKAPAAIGTPGVAAAAEEDSPSHTVSEKPDRQIRWGRIAMVAGALFLLAMGTLTAFELVAGRSVAAITGHSDTRSTLFGGTSDKQSKATPAATPGPSASPGGGAPASAAAPTQQASAQPTDAPATTAPATSAQSVAAQDPAPAGNPDQNLVPGQDQGTP